MGSIRAQSVNGGYVQSVSLQIGGFMDLPVGIGLEGGERRRRDLIYVLQFLVCS